MSGKHTYRLLLLMLLAASVSSCAWMHSDLSGCPEGVRLKLRAAGLASDNLLHEETDEMWVMVYDSTGNAERHVFSREQLAENDYVLDLPLHAGVYQIYVWSGAEDPVYNAVSQPHQAKTRAAEAEAFVSLSRDAAGVQAGYIHPLWQGEVAKVEVRNLQQVDKPVEMSRMTNNLTLLLQDITGQPMTAERFSMQIIAENGKMDIAANRLKDTPVSYEQYMLQTVTLSAADAGTATPLAVCRAEMNTMRLLENDNARLVIYDHLQDQPLININLTQYLLLVREQYEDRVGKHLTAQEYLDQESHYNIVLMLNPSHDTYVLTSLKINGWIVRINDINM